MQENYKETTGQRLKRLRTEQVPRLTQAKLAELVSVEPNYISMLENDRSPLTKGLSVDLAKQLGVSPEYLRCETDYKTYADDFQYAMFQMQNFAAMKEIFKEYVALCAGFKIDKIENNYEGLIIKKGKKKYQIPEEDIESYWQDVLWYANARFNQMIERKKG